MTGMRKEIRISERDGFARRNFPCTMKMGFAYGEFPADGPARMLDAEGEARPVQVDILESWDDGSMRTAEVSFPARLPAGGQEVLSFEFGEGTPPPPRQTNPIKVRDRKDPIEVQQGPVIYQVRKWRFNFVENVIFDGRAFHGPGAPGPALLRKDGQDPVPVRRGPDRYRDAGSAVGPTASGRDLRKRVRVCRASDLLFRRFLVQGGTRDRVW